MDRKAHWDGVYTSNDPTQVGWYRPHLDLSMRLIERYAGGPSASIIDVGGGTSTLVDDLLAAGYATITVLDVASPALDTARARLGPLAERVTWQTCDITQTELPAAHYDLWHDRAVFHFLRDPADRQRYVDCAARAIKSGGVLILATFAADGPAQCSGLHVERYTPERQQAVLGDAFAYLEAVNETHITPAGGEQKYVYGCFRRQ